MPRSGLHALTSGIHKVSGLCPLSIPGSPMLMLSAGCYRSALHLGDDGGDALTQPWIASRFGFASRSQ